MYPADWFVSSLYAYSRARIFPIVAENVEGRPIPTSSIHFTIDDSVNLAGGFVEGIALVGGFVDENVVFREYIKKYASYGGEPKSQNGENRSVFATMRVGASLPPY